MMMTETKTYTSGPLFPYCQKCGWRKGGKDSWNGYACKCGHTAIPMKDDAKAPTSASGSAGGGGQDEMSALRKENRRAT
jgi:hypothetical protein